ncbi:hypothetical protein GCM10009754_82050 [Amycolatopsis minnesotensis]|uniref:Uncharacterized protein n=1 Tax=Amycolatopsis minnesotensis TaxID=337894 RepID=A0ABN2SSC9_9PSEU
MRGTAARIAPIAKTVTLCPAAASLTPRSRLICDSIPAGIVSVRSVMNPVAARASRPASGNRASAAEGDGDVAVRVILLSSMCDIDVRVKPGRVAARTRNGCGDEDR